MKIECGKRDHIMKDCFSLKKNGQSKDDNYQKSNRKESVDAFCNKSSVENNEINLETQVVNSNNNNLEEWLIDSYVAFL